MKKLLSFILLSFVLVTQAKSQTYLLFDNISQYADEAYWQPIQNLEEHKDFFKKVPFSNSTFSSYPKPDLVIIPIGDKPLNYTPSGSSKSIAAKILEYIEDSVDVALFGDSYIYSGGGSDVSQFLFDKMQVSPIARRSTGPNGFIMQGTMGDPVGNAARKYMNVNTTIAGLTLTVLKTNTHADVFFTKDSTIAPKVERFRMDLGDAERQKAFWTDTLLGTRRDFGSSKVAIWTVGLEQSAGQPSREMVLNYVISWFTFTINENVPVINVLDNNVHFGLTNVGDTVERVVSVMNRGKEPLIISDAGFPFLNEGNSFHLAKDNAKFPITIESGKTHGFNVIFSPTEERYLQAWLTFYSNDPSTPETDANLDGSGGLGDGPIIATEKEDNTYDFGEVVPKRTAFIDINVYNKGDQELILGIVDSSEINKTGIFTIMQGTSYPHSLQPDEFRTYKVRFEPLEEKEYSGYFYISSNAANAAKFKIDLLGVGKEESSVRESDNAVSSLSVLPNPVVNGTRIIYSNKSGAVFNAHLKLIDIKGNVVLDIYNGLIYPGENEYSFDPGKLSSGMYIIYAENGINSIRLPIIIAE